MIIPDGKKQDVSDVRTAIYLRAEDVVDSANCRLDRHFMFQGHLKALTLGYEKGVLSVTGQLPSFYLKQVLQTALRDLPGVSRVDNRVEVVSKGG